MTVIVHDRFMRMSNTLYSYGIDMHHTTLEHIQFKHTDEMKNFVSFLFLLVELVSCSASEI